MDEFNRLTLLVILSIATAKCRTNQFTEMVRSGRSAKNFVFYACCLIYALRKRNKGNDKKRYLVSTVKATLFSKLINQTENMRDLKPRLRNFSNLDFTRKLGILLEKNLILINSSR